MGGELAQLETAVSVGAPDVLALLERVGRICEASDGIQMLIQTGQLLVERLPCDAADHLELVVTTAPLTPWVWTSEGRSHARGHMHQLNLATAVTGATVLGWRLARFDHPFADEEVNRAFELLPLLVTLERLADRAARVTVISRGAGSLTAREQSVLALIAQGLTASAVARQLGVAPSTVRKHLEHAYAKLGRHDRLAAVVYAQTVGLLPRPGT